MPNFFIAVVVPSEKLGDAMAYLQRNDYSVSEVRLLDETGAPAPVHPALADKRAAIVDWVRSFLHDAKARSPESAVRSTLVTDAAAAAGYTPTQVQRALNRLSVIGATHHPRRGLVYLTSGRGGRRTFAAAKRRTSPAKMVAEKTLEPADDLVRQAQVHDARQANNHAE